MQNWQGEKWGFNITERWYAGGEMQGKVDRRQQPAEPARRFASRNMDKVRAHRLSGQCADWYDIHLRHRCSLGACGHHLDVGGSYQCRNDVTQFYFKIDNSERDAPEHRQQRSQQHLVQT